MGIDGIKDYCIATRMGDLVFFIIKPTNISVLSDSSISARIYALLNVVKGQAEIEMLALNSKESFERNKNFYQERMGSEELPAIRRLLEQDSKHLDRIQVLMASSREFYIIIRLRSEKETDVFPYLSRIEQSINDNGFTTRRATEQDLKRMLGRLFRAKCDHREVRGLRRGPLGHRGRVNQFITGRGGVPLHDRDSSTENRRHPFWQRKRKELFRRAARRHPSNPFWI